MDLRLRAGPAGAEGVSSCRYPREPVSTVTGSGWRRGVSCGPAQIAVDEIDRARPVAGRRSPGRHLFRMRSNHARSPPPHQDKGIDTNRKSPPSRPLLNPSRKRHLSPEQQAALDQAHPVARTECCSVVERRSPDCAKASARQRRRCQGQCQRGFSRARGAIPDPTVK